jgi:hypothetical protein
MNQVISRVFALGLSGLFASALAIDAIGCAASGEDPEPQHLDEDEDGLQAGMTPSCGDLGGQYCDWGDPAYHCDSGVSTSTVDGCPRCCGGDSPRTSNLSALSCGQLGGTQCQADDNPSGACGGKGPASLRPDGKIECAHCCGGNVNKNGRFRGGFLSCGDAGGTACDNGSGACGGEGLKTYLNGYVECNRCCGGTIPSTTDWRLMSCGQMGGTACQLDDASNGACGGAGRPSFDVWGRVECLHCCGGALGQGGAGYLKPTEGSLTCNPYQGSPCAHAADCAWDIANSRFTPVRAAIGGQVTSVHHAIAGCQGPCSNCNGGNYVIMRGDDGLEVLYFHLESIAPNVTQNGRVERGQPIGAMGDSGCATGTHLHFEVRHGFGSPLSAGSCGQIGQQMGL